LGTREESRELVVDMDGPLKTSHVFIGGEKGESVKYSRSELLVLIDLLSLTQRLFANHASMCVLQDIYMVLLLLPPPLFHPMRRPSHRLGISLKSTRALQKMGIRAYAQKNTVTPDALPCVCHMPGQPQPTLFYPEQRRT
jgi:hypothetical protein